MENSGEIILIAIGTFVMTVISIGIISYAFFYSKKIQLKKFEDELKVKKMQREFYLTLAKTQENEKLHLAQNLHDEVIPLLATLKNKIQINRKNLSASEYGDTVNLLDQTKEVVQRISHDLAPSFLRMNGVFNALESHVSFMANDTLKTNFKNTLAEKSKDYFLPFKHLYIFRICLEVLNNIVKHSMPKKLSLNIYQENLRIVFSFVHDGKGISDKEINDIRIKTQGLGLQSIQARVDLLQGSINYFSEPNDAEVKLSIPL